MGTEGDITVAFTELSCSKLNLLGCLKVLLVVVET